MESTTLNEITYRCNDVKSQSLFNAMDWIEKVEAFLKEPKLNTIKDFIPWIDLRLSSGKNFLTLQKITTHYSNTKDMWEEIYEISDTVIKLFNLLIDYDKREDIYRILSFLDPFQTYLQFSIWLGSSNLVKFIILDYLFNYIGLFYLFSVDFLPILIRKTIISSYLLLMDCENYFLPNHQFHTIPVRRYTVTFNDYDSYGSPYTSKDLEKIYDYYRRFPKNDNNNMNESTCKKDNWISTSSSPWIKVVGSENDDECSIDENDDLYDELDDNAQDIYCGETYSLAPNYSFSQLLRGSLVCESVFKLFLFLLFYYLFIYQKIYILSIIHFLNCF
jgi:hypothetical protein